MDGWATRIEPGYTRSAGVEELHGVCFRPRSDVGGMAGALVCQIPETPRAAVKALLRRAGEAQLRVMFVCDTAQQAREIAVFAEPRLPRHERIPIERAAAGAWGRPN